jgi:hypothetical protein
MAEHLFHSFKISWFSVKHNERAEMPKLMRRESDAGAFFQIRPNRPRDRPLGFWRPVRIHE